MTSTSPPSICVSYARADGQRAAEAIRFYLRGHGLMRRAHVSWHDLVVEDQAQDWRKQIGAALSDAINLITIVSPVWLKSEVSQFAVRTAREQGARLTPVLVDQNIKASDLPSWLKGEETCRLNLDQSNAADVDFQLLTGILLKDMQLATPVQKTATAGGNAVVGTIAGNRILQLDGGIARLPVGISDEVLTSTAEMRSLLDRLYTMSPDDMEHEALINELDHLFKFVDDKLKSSSFDLFASGYRGNDQLLSDAAVIPETDSEINSGNDILSLRLVDSLGKEEDRGSEIAETTHKKKANSLAKDLAAKWREVESILNDAASSPPEVKAAFAASAEFRKVQADYAAAAAIIANSEFSGTPPASALPSSLPDKAPVLYRGKKLDGDPVAFAAKHYAPWLQARILDLPSLESLDKKLLNAVRNETRQSERAEEVRSLFPTVGDAREARGETREMSDLRELWRQQKRRHRARRKEL